MYHRLPKQRALATHNQGLSRRKRDESLTQSRRSFITSLHGSRPNKRSIIIQHDHPSFRQARVEIIDRTTNGIMEIKINMYKRIGLFGKARKGIGNPALVVFNTWEFRKGPPNSVLRTIKSSRRNNKFPSKEVWI